MSLNRMEPAVTRPAASRPRMTANATVLLPEPLSPTTARVSPARTVRFTSRTARTSCPRTKYETERLRMVRTSRASGEAGAADARAWPSLIRGLPHRQPLAQCRRPAGRPRCSGYCAHRGPSRSPVRGCARHSSEVFRAASHSRMPSPSRLTEMIRATMAAAGANTTQGAVTMNARSLAIISPQSGAGGWAPRPR